MTAENRPPITSRDTHTARVEFGHKNAGVEYQRACHSTAMALASEARQVRKQSEKGGKKLEAGSAEALLADYGKIIDWQPSTDKDGSARVFMLDGTSAWGEEPKAENLQHLPQLHIRRRKADAGHDVSFAQGDLPDSTAVTIKAVIGRDGPYLCVAFSEGSFIPDPKQGDKLVSPEPIWIHENDLMLACGLAGKDVIAGAIQHDGTRDMVSRTLANMADASQPLPSAELMARAGERSHITVKTLTSLSDHLRIHAEGRPDDDPKKADAIKKITEFRERIDRGEQPTSQELVDVMVVAGEPGIRAEIAELERQITLTADEAQRAKLREGRKILEDLLNHDADGKGLALFEETFSGELSPELSQKLNRKLSSITDPASFFSMGPEDLSDENSFGHILFEHFAESKGLTKEQTANLLHFLMEHKGDIALMGILTLFEVLKSFVDSSVKTA